MVSYLLQFRFLKNLHPPHLKLVVCGSTWWNTLITKILLFVNCDWVDPPSTHDRTSSSTSNMRAHLAHVHHMAEFLPNPNGTESRAAKRRRTDNGIEYVERQTNNRAQPRDKSTKKIDMLIGIPNKLNSSLIPYIYQLLYFTIGMCWCKEYLPFSLLNSKYLEAIFHELNPDFVMPDRRYISDKIVPHLTQEITEKISSFLKKQVT